MSIEFVEKRDCIQEESASLVQEEETGTGDDKDSLEIEPQKIRHSSNRSQTSRNNQPNAEYLEDSASFGTSTPRSTLNEIATNRAFLHS